MSTPGTQRYSRLMLTLIKGGTKLTRRFVEKRVKDLSENGEEDTIDDFLLKNKCVILQQKSGKNKENVFFPRSGHTNLDNWDLCMFCFILEEICDPSHTTKMRIKKVLKIRNKLCHLHDPTLETEKFDEYFDDLKVSFECFLKEINDEMFTEEMNELVQSLATAPLSMDETLKAIHNMYRSEWTQREVLEKIGSGQDLTNGKLDTLIETVGVLVSRLPSGDSVTIPGIGLVIEVENCSAEEEKEILDNLEKFFNEAIGQKILGAEEDLPNGALHTVRESVKEVFRNFFMRGRHIIIVKQRCLLLTIKCTSVKSFLEMIRDYRTGDLSIQLSGIETAIKNWQGCGNIQLVNLIFKEEFMEVMDDIVSKLCKRVKQTEDTVVQTGSNAENSIRVTLKFPTVSERETVQNRFETEMFVDKMNHIQSELCEMLNVERMSLTDKLVVIEDAVSNFANIRGPAPQTNLKGSSSLENLSTMPDPDPEQDMSASFDDDDEEVSPQPRMARKRGGNESLRAAVDRSYDPVPKLEMDPYQEKRMYRNRKQLEVRFIRYTQDVIDDTFDDGKRLRDTLDDLQHKRYDVDKIPKITVVKKDEVYFSLDNRRLWVLKELATFLEKSQYIVLKVPVKFGNLEMLETRGMTTTTEGDDVRVRQSGSTEEFRNIKQVELSTIRYSADKIYGFSRSGEDELKIFLSKHRDPSQCPVLDVVKRKGKLYALDNRQLWLVKNWFQKKHGGMIDEGTQHSPNIDDSTDSPNSESGIDSQDLEGAVASSDDTARANIKTTLSSEYEVHDDVVTVEMKPYDKFPGYTALENEGLSIRLVQEAEPERNKPKNLKYKPLTRQSPSNDWRSAMRYAEAFKKQPLETIKKK